MTNTSLSFFSILAFSASLIGTAHGNTFLKANPIAHEERISEADVQTSLLSEVEGAFGEGSASSRVKQLEQSLRPMYAALPKNPQGYLGHATVRYALHRLFVQRHGWVIKGLDAAGGHRNSTSDAGLLKEQVPAYIQELFEKRLGGRGFGLHETAVLAATIEHLVHSEAIKRMGDAMTLHNHLPTSVMSEQDADSLLDTYMMSYILGAEAPKTLSEALQLKAAMPQIYPGWEATQEFVRAVRRNVTEIDASAEQKSSGELDFALVARTAERVGEQFGSFQDGECRQMKSGLVKMEEQDTGRVRLSDFYKASLGGHAQFQESAAYLQQLGALDETFIEKPRVIITNFITSQSNCIASSSFYSVCCMDECEGLLSHLESDLASPEATSTQIVRLVSSLSSSSVAAPRKLSPALLDRLREIAAEHGGIVPLHGRLFAQWMHHAFPRECPYPHLADTTNPLTPDEWLRISGEDSSATEEEMLGHVENAEKAESRLPAQVDSMGSSHLDEYHLPWAPEEELLVSKQQSLQITMSGFLRSILRVTFQLVLFVAMVSAAYGLLRNPLGASTKKSHCKVEKYLV